MCAALQLPRKRLRVGDFLDADAERTCEDAARESGEGAALTERDGGEGEASLAADECSECLTRRGSSRSAAAAPAFFAESSGSGCFCDVDLSEPSPGLAAHCPKGRGMGAAAGGGEPFEFKALGVLTPRRVLATAASP